jgi:hypothetical protein
MIIRHKNEWNMHDALRSRAKYCLFKGIYVLHVLLLVCGVQRENHARSRCIHRIEGDEETLLAIPFGCRDLPLVEI